jgi:antitoxin component of MazEF toxin-antitoxin module
MMSVVRSISRWGNGKALRIPGPILEQLGIGESSKVSLSVELGKLVITPVRDVPDSLEELLKGSTRDQFRVDGDEAWLNDQPVGKEVL